MSTLPNISLTQLEYAVALDTYRNFNQAARSCLVTQPTLSMQVQKLEDTLGVIIFDRSRSPVVPTPIGEKIIEQARLVLRESLMIKDIAESDQSEVSGDIKLGILPTIAPYLVPLFLKEFMASFPKVNLSINELQTDQILDMVARDQIDAGILATPLSRQGINELPLYYEPFVAYLPADHPLNAFDKLPMGEIPFEELLLLEEGHCFRNQALQICAHDVVHSRHQASFVSGSLEMLLKLAEQGFGITLLPELMLVGWEKRLDKVKSFAEPVPTREISLVYSRTYLKRSIMDAVTESIRKSVPKSMLKKSGSVLKPI